MPRSGIGLNELLGATLLAALFGCKQYKKATEDTMPTRALRALAVADLPKKAGP